LNAQEDVAVESAVRAAGAAQGVPQAQLRDVISAVRAYLQYLGARV
jgi:hypothetical protein